MKSAGLESRAAPASILSNGSYWTLLTHGGTGVSQAGERALTPWPSSPVEDPNGFFLYLRDLDTGAYWSATPQPALRPPARAALRSSPGRIVFDREDDGVTTRLEIAVAPAAPLEVRQLTVENRSARRLRIEVTSYAEVVLANPVAHAAHPAFSKIFVQTEFVRELNALVARRRPRAVTEHEPCLIHALVGADALEHETDRVRFVRRGNTRAAPSALRVREPLSGTCGNVLDPIVSLRAILELDAGEARSITYVLGCDEIGAARASVAALARDGGIETLLAAAEEAERGRREELGYLDGAAEADQLLGAAVLCGQPGLRAAPEVVARAAGRSNVVEQLCIPPQRAFAVVHAEHAAGRAVLPSLLRAHRYWRELGLPIEMVVLQRGAATSGDLAGAGVHVVAADDLDAAALDALDSRARLVVTADLPGPEFRFPDATAAPAAAPACDGMPEAGSRTPRHLQLENGYGGFDRDSHEYVLRIECRDGVLHGLPPRPWINVVANERFGFLVSETGAGYTWCDNSRENPLTPWSNDPLLDPHAEALYIRDEDTGDSWSPWPGPRPAAGVYEVRHGFGSTTFQHASHALDQESVLFVPPQDPVRITLLRLRNTSARTRRLSVFDFRQLVLGPPMQERCIVTWREDATGAILARNAARDDFGKAVAFVSVVADACTGAIHTTSDRSAFFGTGGSPARPAALLASETLREHFGPGLDACVHQVKVELAAGQCTEIVFLFGQAPDIDAVQPLLEKYRSPDAVPSARAATGSFWSDLLGRLEIHTPSPSLDILVNGWLPYQTLACRLWARSALYQSGGAFGFRDQLQDAAAFTVTWPACTRQQILLHAAHQFVEGDVLHWWHPPAGRGLRTRFADDLLWLPYVAAHYVATTGDGRVLDERIPFLKAPQLELGEDEAYLLPEASGEDGDLYEHCCRALDRSLGTGERGLPLFGTGDWNDGMNRVGREGRGESVWMGFFLYAVLGDFVPLCERRRDDVRVRRYLRHREDLRRALEAAGWDGGWYRRGYYDDGTPLGSHASEECKIDALVQAWAVLSGAAAPERAARALDAVERQLVLEDAGIVRLLTPPFEHTRHDPGYIKGYVPGVRENGGQYTHAALWYVRALATLQRNDRVAALLEMLSPMHHARDRDAVAVYEVEPYVVAADIYGAAPHVGRGGWTWYTGSSGWMYRVVLESLLGFTTVGGDWLRIAPCVPDAWPEFTLRYRVPEDTARYVITARNPHRSGVGVRTARLDGAPVSIENGAALVPLLRDGGLHRVDILLGRSERGGA